MGERKSRENVALFCLPDGHEAPLRRDLWQVDSGRSPGLGSRSQDGV